MAKQNKRFKYKFTVFTPVYNRANILHRPFNSIMAQTFRDFEWVVVDDGSEDNSFEIMKQLAEKADFPTNVISIPHGGKQAAFNKAVQVAQGEIIAPLDSDDEYVPEALERFNAAWESIPENERDNYSGINCLSKDSETGEDIGDLFPQNMMDTNNLELFYKYKVSGEKAGCLRTEALKEFPFWVQYDGHVPETYVWFQLARKYKVRCINEALRVYFNDQANSLIAASKGKKLPPFEANFHYFLWHFDTNLDYLRYDLELLSKTAANIWRFGHHLGKSKRETLSKVNGPLKKGLLLSYLPLGISVAMSDKIQNRV